MKTPKHILVIRLSAMGDVAMVVPVLYAFAKAYPDIKLTVLAKPFFEPILQTIPDINVIPALVDTSHKGATGLWQLSRELKKLKIDAVADLHNVLRSKILRSFLRIPSAIIDKGRADKKRLTGQKNKVFKQLSTTISRYQKVFEELSFLDFQPETLPVPNQSEAVYHFMEGHSGKWIGIAPFAAHPGKEYPQDLMKKILEGLDGEKDTRLVLFGAPNDAERLKKLAISCSQFRIAAGVLSFEDEINLISQLDVMLAMDSGNAHLAAMYGIPTVTLWGVTHPYSGFAPFKQAHHCLLSDQEEYPLIPTSVYGNKLPSGYENVMRTISPSQVITKIKKILQ